MNPSAPVRVGGAPHFMTGTRRSLIRTRQYLPMPYKRIGAIMALGTPHSAVPHILAAKKDGNLYCTTKLRRARPKWTRLDAAAADTTTFHRDA